MTQGFEALPGHRCILISNTNRRLLAVVVTLPYVALIACLAVTFHTYMTVTSLRQQDGEKADDRDIFIQFDAIGDVSDGEILKFHQYRGHKVGVAHGSRIQVSCDGPYVLHADVCSKGLGGHPGKGSLELRVAGQRRGGGADAVLAKLPLEGGKGGVAVCHGLHATVYLRRREEATLRFSSTDKLLKVKNVTLGLHYLLGRQCHF